MIIRTRASQLETRFENLGNLISSADTAHYRSSGIWNDPIRLVMLSACGCIYSNVKDYETENEIHVDFENKQEKMAETSISTLLLSSRL